MLKRIVDVREGEGGRTAVAFVTLLLVVGAYTLVKATRDAVFLTDFGLTELSGIAIGLALVTGFIVTFYLRAARGVRRDRLIAVTHGVIAVSLVALWAGLSLEPTPAWLSWVLYIWSSLFGVFLVMQVWSLVGDLFDVREAKRLFGLVGAGSVVGGLTGGAMAQLLAPLLGTASLLLIAAGMLAAAAGLAWLARGMQTSEPASKKQKAEEAEADAGSPLGTPFLKMIGVGLLLATVVTTLLDWQLKAIAKAEFGSNTDEMAAFFGGVFTLISALSLVLQMLGVGWLLRRWGVGVARVVLPGVLIIACGAILGHAALPIGILFVAAGAKISEGGIRFSLDKVATELTWLAVPNAARSRAKAFVDTVVDRVATGVTGILWLGFATLGFDEPERVHWISAVALFVAFAWLYVQRRTQREYVDAFRAVLATRSLDLDDLRMSLGADRAGETVAAALESGEAGQIRFALYLLEGSEGELPDLSGVVEHEDPDIRAKVLGLLAARAVPGYRMSAAPALAHHDHEVREAAVHYLRSAEMDAFVPTEHADIPRYRFVHELLCLEDEARAEGARRKIDEQLAAADPEERLALVRLIGAAPAGAAAEILGSLLDDENPSVVEAALKAAGRARAGGLVGKLAELLRSRRWRPRAMTALLDIGDEAVPPLLELLSDRSAPEDARRAAARIVGASNLPEAGEKLFALLGTDEPYEVNEAALRALARLRAHTGIELDEARVQEIVDYEIRELHLDLLTLRRGSWALAQRPAEHEELLGRMLRERAEGRLVRISRLLSLRHEPSDIQSAFRGVKSPLKTTRAASLELLDNVVQWGCKQMLLVALGEADAKQFDGLSERIAGLAPPDRRQAMTRLLDCSQRWSAAVAAWHAGNEGWTDLTVELDRARATNDQVAAVAARSLALLSGEHDMEREMSLTVVEKALKLQNVDVLERAASEDLAYIAQIAVEATFESGEPIYASGDPPDALYVVVEGAVRLDRGDVELGIIGEGEAFGSWALFDDEPRMASATTTQATTLLKVDREEFMELLADRSNIVNAVFKAMVARIRALANLA